MTRSHRHKRNIFHTQGGKSILFGPGTLRSNRVPTSLKKVAGRQITFLRPLLPRQINFFTVLCEGSEKLGIKELLLMFSGRRTTPQH